MTQFPACLAGLSAAEEFFAALGVPHDEHVVRVNRLHILKRYHDYLLQAGEEGPVGEEGLADEERLCRLHAAALARAHDDFAGSSAVEQKVFKVFNQVQGRAVVGLDAIEPLSSP